MSARPGRRRLHRSHYLTSGAAEKEHVRLGHVLFVVHPALAHADSKVVAPFVLAHETPRQ